MLPTGCLAACCWQLLATFQLEKRDKNQAPVMDGCRLDGSCWQAAADWLHSIGYLEVCYSWLATARWLLMLLVGFY